MADEAKADEGKAEEVKADGGKAEGGKRSHSPGGGGKVKKPRGARRGGFYGPMRGGPPGWGRPPPPFMEDYDDPGMCIRYFCIKNLCCMLSTGTSPKKVLLMHPFGTLNTLVP